MLNGFFERWSIERDWLMVIVFQLWYLWLKKGLSSLPLVTLGQPTLCWDRTQLLTRYVCLSMSSNHLWLILIRATCWDFRLYIVSRKMRLWLRWTSRCRSRLPWGTWTPSQRQLLCRTRWRSAYRLSCQLWWSIRWLRWVTFVTTWLLRLKKMKKTRLKTLLYPELLLFLLKCPRFSHDDYDVFPFNFPLESVVLFDLLCSKMLCLVKLVLFEILNDSSIKGKRGYKCQSVAKAPHRGW